MVASGARVVVAAKTPGSALEMVGEYWDRYNVNSSHADVATKAATPMQIARNTIPKKRPSSHQLSMQRTLRSNIRPLARKKNRATGRKNMMTEKERKDFLESDDWTGAVTEVTAECKGCKKTISLDKRFTYYPGLWIKHRRHCSAIRRSGVTEAEKISQGDGPSYPRGNGGKKGKGNESTSSSIPLSSRKHVPTSPEEMKEGHPHVAPHLRYDAVSSFQFHHAKSIPVNTNEYDDATEDTNVTAPQYWQSMSNGPFEESYRTLASTMERARFEGTSNDFERDHWTTAPFAPSDQHEDVAVPHESGRRLYRYSTRWELATNFQNTISSEGGGIQPLSER